MTREEEFKEALEAAEYFNEKLSEKYGSDAPIISVTKASYILIINISPPDLPEIGLYFSEDEDRIYYEKGDKYESFKKYIPRKFREIKNKLNLIKF